MGSELNHDVKLISVTGAFCLFLLLIGSLTVLLLPNDEIAPEQAAEENDNSEEEVQQEEIAEPAVPEDYPEAVIERGQSDDPGLVLYRQEETKEAVEQYYTRVAGSEEIAKAVLQAASESDIPLSLAFSLAYAESRFNAFATHTNLNETVDRGLFQLNSASFPELTESDLFDPAISASQGLSYLRRCWDRAGNELSALAMYNAGATAVQRGHTPKSTLDYISKVQQYAQNLDEDFASRVIAPHASDTKEPPSLSAAE